MRQRGLRVTLSILIILLFVFGTLRFLAPHRAHRRALPGESGHTQEESPSPTQLAQEGVPSAALASSPSTSPAPLPAAGEAAAPAEVAGGGGPKTRPVPFPNNTPSDHLEAGFRQVMDKAASTCELEAEYVEAHCEEYPCIAVLASHGEGRPSPERTLQACPAWKQAFGSTIQLMTRVKKCEDGSSELVVLISPRWEAFLATLDAAGRANQLKRLEERWEVLDKGWKCLGPVDPPSEAAPPVAPPEGGAR